MKCEVKVKVKSIRCFHVKSRTLGLPPPRPDASRRQAEAALGRGGRRAGLRGVALCRRSHRAPLAPQRESLNLLRAQATSRTTRATSSRRMSRRCTRICTTCCRCSPATRRSSSPRRCPPPRRRVGARRRPRARRFRRRPQRSAAALASPQPSPARPAPLEPLPSRPSRAWDVSERRP